jgi:hypothetical protein
VTPIPTILNPVELNPAVLITVGIAPVMVGSIMAVSSAGGWPGWPAHLLG